MAYLGTAPGIDSQLITDSVSAGFERALEALVPDPVSGEMVFDEKKIDQIIWESEHRSAPDDEPTYQLPADSEPGRYYPSGPTSAAEFVTSNGNGGGGMFPLLALGLLAYLGGQ